MTVLLRAEGQPVNRKRVRQLMRMIGIAPLGPKPRTTKPATGTQDIRVSAAWRRHRAAEPGLVRGHHLHHDRPRVPVTRCDHDLGQPGGALLDADGREAYSGIAFWFAFYNAKRPIRRSGIGR